MSPDPRSPQAMMQHATFVRSLARSLLRDEHAADDAAQETWLAVLRRPPERAHAVRGWLATILRNKVREGYRRERRRRTHERRAVRVDPQLDAAGILARQETLERVGDAVLALEEPYRTAVLLRHFDDLAPRDIARETGCPVETVKSRLKRAHARLRGSLDESTGAWRAMLAPLAGGLQTGSTALETTTAIGASAVSKKAALALVVLLLAALGAAVWTLRGEAGSRTGGEAAIDSAARPVEEDAPRSAILLGREIPASAPSRTQMGAVGPGRGTSVPALPSPAVPGVGATGNAARAKRTWTPRRGLVTVDGQPATGGTVRRLLPAPDADEAAERAALVEIGPYGQFEIAVPERGGTLVQVTIPGRQSRRVRVSSGTSGVADPVRIVFGRGRIFGVVRDRNGIPVDGVSVRCSTYRQEQKGGYAPSAEGDVFSMAVTTRDGGRYEFSDLPTGHFVLVARPAAGRTDPRNIRSFEIELGKDESRRLDIGGYHYDPVWAGTVRYEDGQAVAYAGNIFLKTEDGERRLYVSFDAEGNYAQEVPPGTYRMEFVLPRRDGGMGSRLVQTDQRLVVHEGGSTETAVLPGGRVDGRIEVEASGGETGPRPRSCHFVLEKADGPLPSSLIVSTASQSLVVSIAEDGTFHADGLAPGAWTVAVARPSSAGATGSSSRAGLSQRVTVSPGSVQEIVLDLSR